MNKSSQRGTYSIMLVMMGITSLVAVAASALLTILLVHYRTQDLIERADSKLLTAAEFTHELIGPGYHDQIDNASSISKERFRSIVERNDDLCRRLNLQYIWSVLCIDGRIVFTSATHSDLKDPTSPCASFFETHHDPESFAPALRPELQPAFCSFKNEWGEGRQVLVPRKDARGRTYIFGASIQLMQLNAMVRRTAIASISIGFGLACLIFIIGLMIGRSFAAPIASLTEAAGRMATGALDTPLPHLRTRELQSLSSSLDKMRLGLKTYLAQLLESEKNYRELVENANSIILRWEPGGTITYFNNFAEKFFGFSQEEILGRQAIGTIVPERDSTNRDLRAMVLDIARNPEKYAKNENENMRKDGSRIWISWTNKAIFDAAGTVCEILCVGNDVTERKRAVEALAKERKALLAVFDALPEFVYLQAPDYSIRYANHSFKQLFGEPGERLCYACMRNRQSPCETCPTFQVFQTKQPQCWEWAAGNRVYMMHDVPFADIDGSMLVLEIGFDITDRKRAEDALIKSEAMLAQSQQIANVGSWDLDVATNLLSWSDETYRIFGLGPQEFVATYEAFLDVVHPDDRATVDEAYSRSLREGLDSYEIEHRIVRRSTGEIRHVHEKCVHEHNEAGEVIRSRGMVQDITERKLAEEALQSKNDELIRFNYTVSHDLKSPLVTIKTFLGYLERDLACADAENVARDMGYIHSAADKMNALLEQLLDLSRIGRLINPPVEAPLQAIVQEALDLVAGRIAERGVRVQVTQKPVLLWGDRPRLVEVFQNLIDNAVKFMGDQREPLVEIGVETKNNESVVFVRDNGMGVDPRYKDKIFGLFEKLYADMEGSGVGLALVKRIMDVHGGRIWVESDGVGKGACFYFTLQGKSLELRG